MKTISIKNPWGYLVAAGIKPIENRTWPIKFRGRVLVHVSAKPIRMKHESDVFTYNQWWQGLTYDQRILMKSDTLANSAIIGSVEIVDCVVNHESIWAEKSGPKSIDYLEHHYNWVLANPVLFAEPILNVKGKLSFWEYPIELCHVCGQPADLICQECERPFCDNHSAVYDQFNQIDFDCCSECAETRKWRE